MSNMSNTDNDDLPNLNLVIKLLRMTTSANDGEALLAMRKANEQIAKYGWDWESLLTGKVTIVEDPFNKINIPQKHQKPSTPNARVKVPDPPAAPAPRRQPSGPALGDTRVRYDGGVERWNGSRWQVVGGKPQAQTPPSSLAPKPSTSKWSRYRNRPSIDDLV